MAIMDSNVEITVSSGKINVGGFESELNEVLRIFKEGDLDGDGTIDSNELANLLVALAGDIAIKDDMDSLLLAMDSNHDGRISFEEFLAFLWGDGREQVRLNSTHKNADARDMNEVELATLELSRDVFLLDRLLGALTSLDRENVTFECCAFKDWANVERELRRPATELLNFLQKGGSVPESLEAAVVTQRRGLASDWGRDIKQSEGGYLIAKVASTEGHKRIAVYQLFGLTKPGTVAVRMLDDGAQSMPEVAALAKRCKDGHTVQIDVANPVLTLIRPVALASHMTRLGQLFDEVIGVIQKQRPSSLEVQYPEPALYCRPVTIDLEDSVEEKAEEKSEFQLARECFAGDLQMLENCITEYSDSNQKFVRVAGREPPTFEQYVDLFDHQYSRGGDKFVQSSSTWDESYVRIPQSPAARAAKDKIVKRNQAKDYTTFLTWLIENNNIMGTFQPNWKRTKELSERAQVLDRWLQSGGDIPCEFESTLLNKRTLKKIWAGSTVGSRMHGGYLVTKEKDKVPQHAVYQLLALKGKSAQVVKLPGNRWTRRLASKNDESGCWEIQVDEAVKLLDMITPTTLLACINDIADEMNVIGRAEKADPDRSYPTFNPPLANAADSDDE